MLDAIFEGLLQILWPDWPTSNRGAWVVALLCACGAVTTFLLHVPRAPAVLAAVATFLIGLLLVLAYRERRRGPSEPSSQPKDGDVP